MKKLLYEFEDIILLDKIHLFQLKHLTSTRCLIFKIDNTRPLNGFNEIKNIKHRNIHKIDTELLVHFINTINLIT